MIFSPAETAVIRYRVPESSCLYGGNLNWNRDLTLLVRSHPTGVGGGDIFLRVVILGSDGQSSHTGPTLRLIEKTRQTPDLPFLTGWRENPIPRPAGVNG